MVSIDQQIKEMKRDIRMRRVVYSQQVRAGKMNPKWARMRYDAAKAILETLTRVKNGITANHQ